MTWRGWHEDDTEPCIRLYNAGLTHREIAETMGKTRNQIEHRVRMLRKAGHPVRVFTEAERAARQARVRAERRLAEAVTEDFVVSDRPTPELTMTEE